MSETADKTPKVTDHRGSGIAEGEISGKENGKSGRDREMKEPRDPKGTKSKKRKRVVRRIILILVMVILLGSAGLYTYAKLKDEYTVTYDSYTATTGTISNSLSFSGTLELIDSASYSAASSAKVRTMYVEAGETVQKGDRLVRLNNGESYTADFDGTVNVVNYAAGDDVAKDALLVQIADFSHMQVSFRVDEYDISDVHVGDACTVTATATEKIFESTVESINYISASSGNVAYYTAVAKVNVDEGVYPGMQVTVTIPKEEAADVVVLKLDALSFTDENKAFVYRMDEEGRMTENEVEVGVSNGNYVEIKSGLNAGDTVYAEAKTETTSTMASLFSGIFGGQRINNGGRQNRQQNNGYGTNTNRERQYGNMPSGGGTGSGSGSGR